MDKCPHCEGVNGFEYRDHGCSLRYGAFWGGGEGSQEIVEIEHSRPVPVRGKCIDCGKSVDIKKSIASA